MAVKFSNNAVTTLSAGISAGATSFTVASASLFPTLASGDWTYVSLTSEVVKVTAISGTTFTCDAVTNAHGSGESVELRMTAELLNDFAEDTESLPLAGGTLTGNLSLGDNVKAKFGASDDLQIYHDGSHSRVTDTGTGNLILKGSTAVVFSSANNGENGRCTDGGGWALGYSGVTKLATTSTGIDVTGSVSIKGGDYNGINFYNAAGTKQTLLYRHENFDGLVIKDIVNNADRVVFKDNGNVGIGTSSPTGKLEVAGSLGNWYIDAQGALMNFTRPSISYISATDVNGGLALRTGGSVERMRIDSSGNVGIGTSSPAGALHIVKSGGAQLRVTTTTGGGGGECKILMGNQDSGGTNKPVIIRGVNGAFKVGTGDDWSADGGGTFLERLTVNSSGRVGIGTSSPSQKLDVSGGHIRLDDAQRIRFGGGTAAVEGSGTSNILQLITNNTERLRIDSSGNVGIGTSSPAKKLDVSGEIRASSGILFGADTAAANALDDYEEGTHAVTVTPQTSGSITLSSDNDLSYTKIGNIVHVHGRITVSSVSSPTGEIHFSLPFTINSGPGRSGDTVGAAQLYSTDFANDSVMVTAYVTEGTSHFRFMGTKDNAGWDSQTVTHAANDIYVVSLTYRTT